MQVVDIKLSSKELLKHALLDSYEFSAHSKRDVWDSYELNGIGINLFVGFDQEAVLNDLKDSNCSKAILAHTHPLLNDDSIIFRRDQLDPRIQIAYGELPLPLGNPPTDGDISLLDSFKKKVAEAGINISGAVFVSSGIWTFDIDPNKKINIEKLKGRKKPNRSGETGDFFKYEIIKGEFPDYFMEVEKPAMHTQKYRNVAQLTLASRVDRISSEIKIIQKDYAEEIENHKKYYRECGVILDFLPYRENNLDALLIMRKCIEEWKNKFLTIDSSK
ncbi:MAG: hypothetical protein WCO16_03190 [bacterium]